MDQAPDPILSEPSLWPVVLLVAIVGVTLMTIAHAMRRRRWVWAAGLVVGLPLVLPLYWLAELALPRTARGAPSGQFL